MFTVGNLKYTVDKRKPQWILIAKNGFLFLFFHTILGIIRGLPKEKNTKLRVLEIFPLPRAIGKIYILFWLSWSCPRTVITEVLDGLEKENDIGKVEGIFNRDLCITKFQK